jgi:hypothetical protein
MKRLLLIITSFSLVLFSCTEKTEKVPEAKSTEQIIDYSELFQSKNDQTQVSTKPSLTQQTDLIYNHFTKTELAISEVPNPYQSFLAYFESISFDTLHVFTPRSNDVQIHFVGKKVPVEYYTLFGQKFANRLHSYHSNGDTTVYNGNYIFGCFKFQLQDYQIGLILRTMGKYEETSVELWSLNLMDNTITKFADLADDYGDGEWLLQIDSWITDLNSDQLFDIVKVERNYWVEEIAPTDENSGWREIDHLTVTSKISLGTKDGFIETDELADTSKFRMVNWRY